MPDVAVLVLNWNGRRWLSACLDALLAQAGPRFQAVLVDNGSADGSQALVRERFPAVHVLELGANLGFGRAYNRAIAVCDAPLVVLLNNDTAVQPGWLAALVAEAEAHPEAAAIGSELAYIDRPDVLNHAGGRVTVLGAGYDVGFGALDGPEYSNAGTVGCATGAAMLVRRAAFLEAGGFDESYFAYFEDADLCWRLWLRGYTVRYAPAARVLHAYGGSSGLGRASPFRIEHCQANRLLNMVKNLEAGTLAWALPASLAYDAMRLRDLLRSRQLAAARAYVRGTRRFLGLLSHALRQRRQVQASRVRGDAELFRLGALTGLPQAAAEWRRLSALGD